MTALKVASDILVRSEGLNSLIAARDNGFVIDHTRNNDKFRPEQRFRPENL